MATTKEENRKKCADYYAANKKKIAARRKAYYAKNKANDNARSKAYADSHKKQIAARQKDHRQANKDQVEAYNKAYYKENKKRERARARTYRLENLKTVKAKQKLYSQSAKGKAARKKYDARIPEKIKARWKLRNAVQQGLIVKCPCEQCGAIKAHGHHPDHSKPLEVIWLCEPCHKQLHREEREQNDADSRAKRKSA